MTSVLCTSESVALATIRASLRTSLLVRRKESLTCHAFSESLIDVEKPTPTIIAAFTVSKATLRVHVRYMCDHSVLLTIRSTYKRETWFSICDNKLQRIVRNTTCCENATESLQIAFMNYLRFYYFLNTIFTISWKWDKFIIRFEI